jgi:hypothetical protein
MAKVTFTQSVKIDSLGRWQQPILDAARAAFDGAKANFVPLPMGRAGLVVLWRGFHGHDVTERQEMVRATIARLGADAAKRVAMIVTLTPEEAKEMDGPEVS